MQTGGEIMSDYSSTIKKLNDDLFALLNEYEKIETKTVVTNHTLKKIIKQINSHNFTSNQHVENLQKHDKNFQALLKKVSEYHTQDINIINSQLDVSLDVINDKYVKNINLLKDKINNFNTEKETKINELNQDIDYFFIASEQKADLLDEEYNRKYKMFEYQINNAKKTYKANIKKHNDLLNEKLLELEDKHENVLVKFDQQTDEIVNRLKARIDKHIVELNDITNKLTNVKNQSKEKMRQESVLLNEQIHEILIEKNNSIDNVRERYNNSLTESSLEKEKKRQEYQANSQRVLKEFVYNMTELDEFISNYKITYNKNVENEKRKFQYKILDLVKGEEASIKAILNNTNLNEDSKHLKKIIKAKNKEYHKIKTQYEINQDKNLNSYKLNYERELEKARCNKNLMDIDRAHALKLLNEHEQSNNKHFQEQNNIYENNLNYLIKYSNLRYNQKANLLKGQSRIRVKNLEKDLDMSEANFQKKIEMVNTSIEKLNLEINGAVDLNNLVHNHEEEEFKAKINNLSVSTLLEIEKCKLLDQFNHRQYDYNNLEAKTNLLYGQKRISIENEKYETLTKLEMDKIRNSLQGNIISAAYKIKEEQICEDEDKKVQIRNSQYAIDSRNHRTIHDRFKGEIKIIHQTLSTFVLLVRDLQEFILKTLTTFLNSININESNYIEINKFISSFLDFSLYYFKGLVKSLNETETKIINKHLEYEEKFKFQVYYNELLTTYENDRKRLLTKKKSITDTLDNYIKTVELFKSRLYSLENQNYLLLTKINSITEKTNEKETLENEYRKNNTKANDLTKKINDILKFKTVLEKDQKSILNELKLLDIEYNDRVMEIKKMQYNSAVSYYTLRNDFSKISSNIIDDSTNILNNIKKTNPQTDIDTFLNNFNVVLDKFNESTFKKLYGIVNKFNDKTQKSLKKDKSLLVYKFENDIAHIHNKARLQIEENNRDFDKKISNNNNQYRTLEAKYADEKKRFNNQLVQIENQYKLDSVALTENKNKSLIRFYTEFNAMCDNLKDIEQSYKAFMNNFKNKFQHDKISLSKGVIHESNVLSLNLESFLKSKDEIINHLPSATKFQSQLLNKEIRDLNSQIDQDLKAEKLLFNSERKNIHRNIQAIKESLEQAVFEHEEERQKTIAKEKKNHIMQLRHIEGNYKYQ